MFHAPCHEMRNAQSKQKTNTAERQASASTSMQEKNPSAEDKGSSPDRNGGWLAEIIILRIVIQLLGRNLELLE